MTSAIMMRFRRVRCNSGLTSFPRISALKRVCSLPLVKLYRFGSCEMSLAIRQCCILLYVIAVSTDYNMSHSVKHDGM